MDLQIIHDKTTIFNFLNKSSEHQVYSIGDLDDFFWPKTIWYALVENNSIQSIALLYVGMETPTLLAFYKENPDYSIQLLKRIKTYLPVQFYAHLSPKLIEVFGNQNIVNHFGCHHKMALRKTPIQINDLNIRKLSISDLPAIQHFYTTAYPQNWFDSRMLETNKYYGYFISDQLVGISGIHVYSANYKVAALGNIATHPDFRGKQIGFKLTSVLCCDLLETANSIGLNVKINNEFAIRCYEKIGFEKIGTFDEYLIKNV